MGQFFFCYGSEKKENGACMNRYLLAVSGRRLKKRNIFKS